MNERFTDAYIRKLKAKGKPYKLTEWAAKGEGRLMVRVQPTGSKEFFYRYRANGGDTTLALGRYDADGKNGRTLAQIRGTLRDRRELQRSTGDVKNHLATEALRRVAEGRKGTLLQLLVAYCEALRTAGKESASKVEAIFRRNVIKPFPGLAATKASKIEPGDIQRILARMVKAGITRQVNVTRSYLRAAFAFGMKADHDPRTVAKDGVLFGLKTNPVEAVPRIGEFERVGNRVLTEDELREFWRGLDALPMVQAATIRFNLALAGQRPTQLLRAGWPEFDLEGKTILLSDGKGRGDAREHLLPLTAFALDQLKPLRDLNSDAPSPFTADGKRRMVVETLSKAVAEISASLKKIPEFSQRDLRRTTETMLQKLGIDKEVRAHLLSHGRSKGVQGKHYERYDFLPEKRAALEKWGRHLKKIITGEEAKVVQGNFKKEAAA